MSTPNPTLLNGQPIISVLDSTGTPYNIPVSPYVGQETMSESTPVTMASDQPAIWTTFNGSQQPVYFQEPQTVNFGSLPQPVEFLSPQKITFNGSQPVSFLSPQPVTVVATNPVPVHQLPLQPGYTVSLCNLAPTGGTNLLVIEAGPTYTSRVRRLTVIPGNVSTGTGGFVTLTLSRTTGTTAGGTLPANLNNDPSDPVFGGVARTAPFTGTDGVTPTQYIFQVPIPGAGQYQAQTVLDFTNHNTIKGLAIPHGPGHGLMLTTSGLPNSQGFGILAEWVEESATI